MKKIKNWFQEESMEVCADLMKLQYKMCNTQAFDLAIQYGYIRMGTDGHLVWTLGSETLFAYFAGRLFCGDCSKHSIRKDAYIWTRAKNDREFPLASLQRLFGYHNLKRLRNKRYMRELPISFEVVDALFKEIS